MRSTRLGLFVLVFAACGGKTDTDPVTTGDTGTVPTTGVDRDSDGFTAEQGDCDDGNPLMYPGAAEVCDGFDNDCDNTTQESGASFQVGSQAAVDRTSELSSGTAAAPLAVNLDQDGTLNLCEGTWYLSLHVTANARLNGPAGAASTVLHGGDVTPGIVIDAPVTFGLQGVSLAHYAAAPDGFGGALDCGAEGASIMANEVEFSDNTASVGGAVAIRGGCALSLQAAQFDGGSARLGGHLAISESTVDMVNVSFTGGTATSGGGSVAIGAELTPFNSATSGLRCRNCRFEGNQATDRGNPKSTAGGGAIWVQSHTDVRLLQSTFTDNVADGAGGAALIQSIDYDGAVASFDTTTFTGNLAGAVGNAVSVPALKADYDYDGEQSVRCDEVKGCVAN